MDSAEAEVGEMRRLRFEEIREFACRWPLGDPMSKDFAYCGLKAAKGCSYCSSHWRMAYQPPKARTRHGPHERRASPAFAESVAAALTKGGAASSRQIIF